MIQIILLASEQTRAAALASGFREQTVLIKGEAVPSTPENKARLERECFDLHPFQFAVTDYWGAEPD